MSETETSIPIYVRGYCSTCLFTEGSALVEQREPVRPRERELPRARSLRHGRRACLVAIDLLNMAVLRLTLAPSQGHSPMGQEHSRAIPLADLLGR